jgi:hypothetical protein
MTVRRIAMAGDRTTDPPPSCRPSSHLALGERCGSHGDNDPAAVLQPSCSPGDERLHRLSRRRCWRTVLGSGLTMCWPPQAERLHHRHPDSPGACPLGEPYHRQGDAGDGRPAIDLHAATTVRRIVTVDESEVRCLSDMPTVCATVRVRRRRWRGVMESHGRPMPPPLPP